MWCDESNRLVPLFLERPEWTKDHTSQKQRQRSIQTSSKGFCLRRSGETRNRQEQDRERIMRKIAITGVPAKFWCWYTGRYRSLKLVSELSHMVLLSQLCCQTQTAKPLQQPRHAKNWLYIESVGWSIILEWERTLMLHITKVLLNIIAHYGAWQCKISLGDT